MTVSPTANQPNVCVLEWRLVYTGTGPSSSMSDCRVRTALWGGRQSPRHVAERCGRALRAQSRSAAVHGSCRGWRKRGEGAGERGPFRSEGGEGGSRRDELGASSGEGGQRPQQPCTDAMRAPGGTVTPAGWLVEHHDQRAQLGAGRRHRARLRHRRRAPRPPRQPGRSSPSAPPPGGGHEVGVPTSINRCTGVENFLRILKYFYSRIRV